MKPTYESPLASRYASKYMLHLFSDDSRYQTWRRLWAALARAQHQLGLPITEAQAAELDALVEKTFEGSLPAFVAAFARKTKLSQSEVDQLRAMIDGFEEAQK